MKNWVNQKINDFCYVTDFVANGSFASLRENVTYINKPDYAVLVRLTDFTKKWSKDFVYVSKTSYNFLKKSFLKPGDLIMSNVGEPGIVFLVPDLKKPMTLGPNSILIRPYEKNSSSKYLFLYFLSEKGKKQIDDISTGAAQKKFNKTSFRELEIPLPLPPEQQRIVAILDKTFEAIAKAKANAEQNLKNAKELFESYLQSVFTNKGKNWEERMLKEIGVAQTGTTPKTADKENYGDYIPFIKPADIDITGNGEIRYDNEGLSEQGLKNGRKMLEGSILMVCIGATIGKVGYIDRDVSCNQQINSLTVRKEFSPKFIYYALSTKDFFEKVIHNAAQATLPIINKGKWETLTVCYPKSKAEQLTIVQKLDSLSAETNKLEAIYQQKLNDLEELKKSILQKAFNGELKTA